MANLLITIGDCDVIDNNYIGSKDTTSEFGCFIACVTTEDCNYYNWFTDLYHRDGCSLFSVCDTVSPCSYHGVHISWHTYNYILLMYFCWNSDGTISGMKKKQYII